MHIARASAYSVASGVVKCSSASPMVCRDPGPPMSMSQEWALARKGELGPSQRIWLDPQRLERKCGFSRGGERFVILGFLPYLLVG